MNRNNKYLFTKDKKHQLRANQRLKLTEPAVSFSPRAKNIFLRERQCLPRV